jgi:hypothetical protein
MEVINNYMEHLDDTTLTTEKHDDVVKLIIIKRCDDPACLSKHISTNHLDIIDIFDSDEFDHVMQWHNVIASLDKTRGIIVDTDDEINNLVSICDVYNCLFEIYHMNMNTQEFVPYIPEP